MRYRDNIIKTLKEQQLTTVERKRYQQSSQYFLDGTAKQLSNAIKKQSFDILDKYKIKRLEDDYQFNKSYALKVGLFIGGLWLLKEGVEKVYDNFPYNIMDKIDEGVKSVRNGMRQYFGEIMVKMNISEMMLPAIDSIKNFMSHLFDVVGLSFDIPSSYSKYGNMLIDGSQRQNGVFGDLIELTFQNVLWFAMQRSIPELIKNYWNLPYKTRLETDRGIIEELWNDNTGYFHDIGNPYRRRLDSITAANEGLNNIQQYWANANKDVEDIFKLGFIDQWWNVTNLEDLETNEHTLDYIKKLNSQVNQQMQKLKDEIRSGIYEQWNFNRGVQGKYGLPEKLYMRKKSGKETEKFDASVQRVHGLTYTATMPYSGMRKGLWDTKKVPSLKPINDIILKADEIITKFTYDSSNSSEQQLITEIKTFWKNYGNFNNGTNGYWYHYTLGDIFDLISFLPHLVRLETFAAMNSIDGAKGIYDAYLKNNSFQQLIDSNIDFLIQEFEKGEGDYENYKRGVYTAKEFVDKKYNELSNLLSKDKKYLTKVEKVCQVLLPKLFKDANISKIVYGLQGIKNQMLQLSTGALDAVVITNTSSSYNSFNTKESFKTAKDVASHIEGKQISSQIDKEFRSRTFFIDDEEINLSQDEENKIRSNRKTSKIPDVKSGTEVGDIVEHGGRKWMISKVESENIWIPSAVPGGIPRHETVRIFYGYPDDGIIDKITYRTIKEDGTIWLEDFYRYTFNNTDVQQKIVSDGTPPRKDTSDVSSYFGNDLSSSILKDQMSTTEKSYFIAEQVIDYENLIANERKRRKELLSKLAEKVDNNGLSLFLYPFINKINERSLAK